MTRPTRLVFALGLGLFAASAVAQQPPATLGQPGPRPADRTPTDGGARPAVLAQVGLTPGWATFGLACPRGAVRDQLRVGRLDTQTDVKVRWPDGSLRFAVVTARVTLVGTYQVGEGPPDRGETETSKGRTAFEPVIPEASIRLTIDEDIYTATLPRARPDDAWLVGPLVVEGRAMVAPVGPQGKTHPFLRVLFDVRSYRDGSGRLDVTVENVLDQADATAATYDVEILVGGKALFGRHGVTHPYLTRWRWVSPLGLIESEVTPDLTPASRAGALPRYLPLVADTIDPVSGAGFDILRAGGLDPSMPDHGGRPELAPYPDWAARYLVHRHPRQRRYVLAHGNLSGSWPIHLREPAGPTHPGGPTFKGIGPGRLVSIDERPDFWLDRRADPGNTPAADPENYASGYDSRGALASPLIPDIAHQPSLAYIPYQLTGDRYYTDEMAFWANYTLIRTYQDSHSKRRGGGRGLLHGNEVRGIGWGLRNLADAAAYLPDGDPVKDYLARKVMNNLEWLDDYADRHETPLGTLWEDKRPENDGLAPRVWIALWEQDYVAWAIDHANRQGFVGGRRHRDKIARLQLKLFTSETDYPRDAAAPYVIPVGVRNAVGTIVYFTSMEQLAAGVQTRPFPGYYGPEARLVLMIAVANGWPRAREAYDVLFRRIGREPYMDGLPDLARRAGWAIALDGEATMASPASRPRSSPPRRTFQDARSDRQRSGPTGLAGGPDGLPGHRR